MGLIEKIFWYWIEILIFLIFVGYSITKLSIWYLFWFISITILVQIFVYYLWQKIKKSKYEEVGIKSERSRSLIKIIMSKFEIQQQGQYQKEIEILDEHTNDLYKNILWRINNVHVIFFLPEFVWAIMSFIVFFVIWYGIFDGKFTFSILVLFAWVLTLLNWLIHKLTTFIKDFIKDFWTIEKLRDTFDNIPEMKWYDEWFDFEYRKWNFELRNIAFSYGKTTVFQDFSLKIKWWTKIAFVWESWWWKTTLIKLLAGYIFPDKWEIKIDDQILFCGNISSKQPLSKSKISLKSYYKHIWYLSQDPSIFDGTIKENLLYGSTKKIGLKKVKEIIKLSKCEFIRNFEKWLDTEIGERGVRLSWWQKQRLAIAKIMLKNPNIILLDEPTSALDSFNEELITEALHNLFKWKTVIIVAHRLQTVKEADQIMFIENGKIVEQWTHSKLIKQKWKYHKMLKLQSGF